MDSASPRLVEYFVVVGMDASGTEARIVDRFPREDYPDHPLPQAVPIFCLPQGVDCGPKTEAQLAPRYFSFGLTDVDGRRSYGSCLSYYEKSDRHNFRPKVLCLLSLWPYFSLHKAFLSELYHVCCAAATPPPPPPPASSPPELRRRTSAAVLRRLSSALPFHSQFAAEGGGFGLPVERLIASLVFETPVMPPGCQLQMPLLRSTISYVRRPLTTLPHVDDACFRILFQCLSPQHVVQLLECVLVEQKVLLHSQHNGTLMAVTEALLALCFPFCWYHVYVPVLPLQLVDYLEVPTPFIFGMHTLCLSTKSAMSSISSCVLVHLDSDKIVTPMTITVGAEEDVDAMPELPPQFRAPLIASLESIVPAAEPIDAQQRQRSRTRSQTPVIEEGEEEALSDEEEEGDEEKDKPTNRLRLLQRQASETFGALFGDESEEPYHEYTVTFAAGPLGLEMESTHHRLMENGSFDGRKHTSFDCSAVVKGYKRLPGGEKGPAERSGLVGPGSYLVAINGESTLQCTFKQTIQRLRAASRPLTLRFQNGRRGELPQTFATALAAATTKNKKNKKSSKHQHHHQHHHRHHEGFHWVDEARAAVLEVFVGLFRNHASSDSTEAFLREGCPADWMEFMRPFSGTQAYINFTEEVGQAGDDNPELALWRECVASNPGELLRLVARSREAPPVTCSPLPLNEEGIAKDARFSYRGGFPALDDALFAARAPELVYETAPASPSLEASRSQPRAHVSASSATAALPHDERHSSSAVLSQAALLDLHAIEDPPSSPVEAEIVVHDLDHGGAEVRAGEVVRECVDPAALDRPERERASIFQRVRRAVSVSRAFRGSPSPSHSS